MEMFRKDIGITVGQDDLLKLTFKAKDPRAAETSADTGRALAASGREWSSVKFTGFFTPEADFWVEKLNDRIWKRVQLVTEYNPRMTHTFDVPGPIRIKATAEHSHLTLECRRLAYPLR